MPTYETIPVVDADHPVVNMNDPLIPHDDPFFVQDDNAVNCKPVAHTIWRDGGKRDLTPADESEERRFGMGGLPGGNLRVRV